MTQDDANNMATIKCCFNCRFYAVMNSGKQVCLNPAARLVDEIGATSWRGAHEMRAREHLCGRDAKLFQEQDPNYWPGYFAIGALVIAVALHLLGAI